VELKRSWSARDEAGNLGEAARLRFNGKRLEEVKVPHGVNRKDFISIAIVLTPNSIQHKILQNRQWHVIDTWERQGAVLQGSFGFHIPSRDEISLSDFQFTPE
jgi:hypothetical protein